MAKSALESILNKFRTLIRVGDQHGINISTQDISNIDELIQANKQEWEHSKAAALGGPKVLIANNVPGLRHASKLESILAVALTLRGAEVHIALCDQILPGCQFAEQNSVENPKIISDYRLPETICGACVATGKSMFDPLELPIHHLSSHIEEDERLKIKEISDRILLSEVQDYKFEGYAVGEHAYAGALRYFATGNFNGQPYAEEVARRYLEASLLAVAAYRKLLSEIKFDAACFHHGIYVPQGLVGEVCRKENVPVVNWNPAYRQNTFIFSHNDTYHHTLLDEPVSHWKDMSWSSKSSDMTMSYLKSRKKGTRDWIWFHEKPDEDFKSFAIEQGIDTTKPIIGMLTNVMWDAQLHYKANAFSSMLDWTIHTINYFANHPELQLVIRIHPAEIRGTMPSRQPLLAEIDKAFTEIPDNVFIIPPESHMSTYAAMDQCNAVLIYGTKMGVELTSFGIPVIVGGEAWIRNKDLTYDATSPEEYDKFLDQLPFEKPLDKDVLTDAQKYAFHFFFRRMIPLPFMVASEKEIYDIKINNLRSLKQGSYPGLDVICNGILNHSPFIYEAENFGLHDQ